MVPLCSRCTRQRLPGSEGSMLCDMCRSEIERKDEAGLFRTIHSVAQEYPARFHHVEVRQLKAEIERLQRRLVGR